MSQQTLTAAIGARWVAAGLDSSVAKLYYGGATNFGTYRSNRASGASPEGTVLNRAEFMINVPAPQKSRHSRISQAVVIFHVWTTTANTANQYLNLIYNAFVNQESNITMSDGDILDVDDGGQFTVKEDDAVFFGQQLITVRHRINQP